MRPSKPSSPLLPVPVTTDVPSGMASASSKGAAAVVLESHKGLGCQVGLDGDVADRAVGAAHGFGGNNAQTFNAIFTHIVRTAEQLIAAADSEQRAAILNIGSDLVFLSEQLVRHGKLVAIGATAHHDDVGVR